MERKEGGKADWLLGRMGVERESEDGIRTVKNGVRKRSEGR